MEVLSMVLIVLGIGLLVAEIFIPSFGVTGTLGIIAIIGGIVTTAKSVAQGTIMFLIIMVIVLILMFLAYKFIASKSSPLILKGSVNEEKIKEVEYFLHKEGIAITPLRPSGKGDFDGVRLDILTRGNFVTKGKKISIVELAGKKIIVEEVK